MNLLRKLSVVIVAIVSTSFAYAEPIVLTAPCVDDTSLTCTTGIDNLSYMDMTLDVEFVLDSYDSIFSDFDPFFLGDIAGSDAMSDLIRDAINAVGDIFGVVGAGSFAAVLIPEVFTELPTHSNNGGACVAKNTDAPDAWTSLCNYGARTDLVFNGTLSPFFQGYAVFTDCSPFPGGGSTEGCFPGPGPFPAPEPSTLALLGIGLFGMGLSRRRKKA